MDIKSTVKIIITYFLIKKIYKYRQDLNKIYNLFDKKINFT